MLNVTRQKAERGQRLTLRSEIRRPTLVKRHDLSELKRRRVNIAHKAVTRGCFECLNTPEISRKN